MRKLTKGNKISFAIFMVLIIIIAIFIIVAVIIAKKNAKEKVAISSNSYVYDKNYNYIELENDAQIFQNITGGYHLKEDKTNKEYDLGRFAISYNSSNRSLDLFGTFYEVTAGGNVTKLNAHNIIKSTTTGSQFYKIDDRKYLIVSSEINSDKQTVSAQNYLIIIMDKAGNALLLNDKINMKTINSIVLTTDEFKFDIANEKLIYGNEKIDLKKILGSTNEYTKPDQTPENIDGNNIDENEMLDFASTGDGTSGSTGEGYSSSGGGYGGSSSGDSSDGTLSSRTSAKPITTSSGSRNKMVTTLNTWIKSVSNGFQSIFNGNQKTKNTKDTLEKSIHLDSITAGTTYLDINYTVTDPENKYNVVYINISSSTKTTSIALNKSEKSYRVTGLEPNTNYTVEMGYKIIYSDATNEEVIEDSMVVKTLSQNERLAITRISPSKVYYELKLDSNYVYDAGCKLVLTAGDSKQTVELTSDMLARAAGNGLSGVININNTLTTDTTIELKLIGTKINGKEVNRNLYSKVNYY